MTKFGEYITTNWRELFRIEQGYVQLYTPEFGRSCSLNPDCLLNPDALIDRVQNLFAKSHAVNCEKFKWVRRIYDETIKRFPNQKEVYILYDGELISIDSKISISVSARGHSVIEKMSDYIENSGDEQLAIVSGNDYPEFIRLQKLERCYWLHMRIPTIVRNSLLIAYAKHCVGNSKNSLCVAQIKAGSHKYTVTLDDYKYDVFEEDDKFSPIVYVELFFIMKQTKQADFKVNSKYTEILLNKAFKVGGFISGGSARDALAGKLDLSKSDVPKFAHCDDTYIDYLHQEYVTRNDIKESLIASVIAEFTESGDKEMCVCYKINTPPLLRYAVDKNQYFWKSQFKSDIDVFFPSDAAFNEFWKDFRYLVESNQLGRSFSIPSPARFGIDVCIDSKDLVQIIQKKTGSPDEILDSFDILNAQVYYDGKRFHYTDEWEKRERLGILEANKKRSHNFSLVNRLCKWKQKRHYPIIDAESEEIFVDLVKEMWRQTLAEELKAWNRLVRPSQVRTLVESIENVFSMDKLFKLREIFSYNGVNDYIGYDNPHALWPLSDRFKETFMKKMRQLAERELWEKSNT